MDNQPSPQQDGEMSPTGTSPIQESELKDSIPAEPATAEQLTEVEKQMTGFEKATLRWAKIAVLLSGLAAAFVCAQWFEMHKGGEDTHALAQAADTQAKKMIDMSAAADKIRQAAENMVVQDQRIADNAQVALDASNRQSKASLDATIEISRLEQRAWVGPTTMILKEMHAPDPINADVTIINSGKTPALDTRVRYYLYVSDTVIDIEKTSKSILAMSMGESTVSTLFPNQTNHLIAPTSSTDELAIQSVKAGRKLLYLFAWVWYEDVFHKSHETRFCAQFRPNGQVLSPCDGQYDYAN